MYLYLYTLTFHPVPVPFNRSYSLWPGGWFPAIGQRSASEPQCHSWWKEKVAWAWIHFFGGELHGATTIHLECKEEDEDEDDDDDDGDDDDDDDDDDDYDDHNHDHDHDHHYHHYHECEHDYRHVHGHCQLTLAVFDMLMLNTRLMILMWLIVLNKSSKTSKFIKFHIPPKMGSLLESVSKPGKR